MKKLTIIIISILLAPLNVQAASQCEDQINVRVNGLVCDFCARALEKVFGRRDDVADILVDLDDGLVRVNMQPGQTIDDAELTTLIQDSGYNVTHIDKGC